MVTILEVQWKFSADHVNRTLSYGHPTFN